MKETFGQFIRRNRNLKGFTLTQLAAKLNLDSANLSKIENGKREMDLKRLKLLSVELSINYEEIKAEYFSDIFAKKIYENDCQIEVLKLAEEKFEYYRTTTK